MPHTNEAQIRAVLSAAREARQERDRPQPRRGSPAPAGLPASPDANPDALLASAGVDQAEFDRIRAQHRVRAERLAWQQRSASATNADASRAALRARISELREARRRVPALGTAFVDLDAPLFISSTPGLVTTEELVSPWHSMARFYGVWSTPYPDPVGTDALDFVFVWTNTGRSAVTVRIHPVVAAVGSLAAYANPFQNESFIEAFAWLNVFAFWNNPPTQVVNEASLLGQVTAWGGTPPWLGDYESASVSTFTSFNSAPVTVPAGETLVIEVEFLTYRAIDDGYAAVDFTSGEGEVLVPDVILTVSS